MLPTDITPSPGPGSPAAHPLLTNHLRLADFAASLSQRLLAETQNDCGAEDEFLRGYARAASDLAEALLAGDLFPGGAYCSRMDD